MAYENLSGTVAARNATVGVTPQVYVIGVGMGNPQTLTLEARDALERSQLIIGSARLVEALADLAAERVALVGSEAIARRLCSSGVAVASVVMSGDVGFYSGATTLYQWLEGLDVRVIPGISSVSYLCAKLRTPWQDAHLVSAHGRAHNVVGAVQCHAKTFVLTGGAASPQALCAEFCERGLGDVRVVVGERLSYPDERITAGTARELAAQAFDGLAAMLVENSRPLRRDALAPHLSDAAFVRGEVPMTKEEVRALAICKLRIGPASTVWDIGAGTGSVSVEAARSAYEGQVLAIERDERARTLIAQNKAAFGLVNLRIVAGEAPAALEGLPTPDCVFVGGSAGQLEDILRAAIRANPAVRLCVAAVTLETLSQTLGCLRTLALRNVDIVQVSVAKGREVGSYHLMAAHNPIYLLCADGPNAIDGGVSAGTGASLAAEASGAPHGMGCADGPDTADDGVSAGPGASLVTATSGASHDMGCADGPNAIDDADAAARSASFGAVVSGSALERCDGLCPQGGDCP